MPEIVTAASLELGTFVTGLGGGLALFLFGMRQMTESLKTVAGSSMKNLLAKLTANRFTAALAGIIITAVIQSSSVTTVLMVGFISAGLLTLEQSIGVIIGANVGTTITAQIIAFNVSKYGLLMIAIGFLADIIAKNEKIKQWGMVLMGLGLVFFGMELMSNATGPLRQWPPFIEAMQNMQSRLWSIAIGLGFIRPLYLDEIYLDQPAMALEQVRRELVRLAELDREMLDQAFGTVTVGTQHDIERVRTLDNEVDELYGAVILYLGKLSQKNLVHPLPKQLSDYIAVANYLENVGDVVESNVLTDSIKRIRRGVAVSPETISVLKTVHDKVCWSFERAMAAIRDHDQTAAADAVKSKADVNHLAEAATTHLSKRLVAYEPNRLAAFKLETNIIENLQRINTLSRRIGKTLQTEGKSAVDAETPMS